MILDLTVSKVFVWKSKQTVKWPDVLVQKSSALKVNVKQFNVLGLIGKLV